MWPVSHGVRVPPQRRASRGSRRDPDRESRRPSSRGHHRTGSREGDDKRSGQESFPDTAELRPETKAGRRPREASPRFDRGPTVPSSAPGRVRSREGRARTLRHTAERVAFRSRERPRVPSTPHAGSGRGGRRRRWAGEFDRPGRRREGSIEPVGHPTPGTRRWLPPMWRRGRREPRSARGASRALVEGAGRRRCRRRPAAPRGP